jgi:chromosome partitioning protein
VIIAIANQKGGVGKSTTALALAAGLIVEGRRVLLIDADAQGNTTTAAGASAAGITIYDVMTGEAAAGDAIQDVGGLSIIPAGAGLAKADRIFNEQGSEYRLKEAIAPVTGYNYIIIDTPPALGILTVNALTAAQGVIIPTAADAFGLQGIAQLRGTIGLVKKYSNSDLRLMGILLTKHRPTRIMKSMEGLAAQIAADMGTQLYSVKIRESTAIREAQALSQSLFCLLPRSPGALDYMAFTKEFLTQVGDI